MKCIDLHSEPRDATGYVRYVRRVDGAERVIGPYCDPCQAEHCVRLWTDYHSGADQAGAAPLDYQDGAAMTREQRIAKRTRDPLDEIVEESHVSPASVSEVADEIARYVIGLTDSGAAHGLHREVINRLNAEWAKRNRACRQGAHRDEKIVATNRVRYIGPRGGSQQWTTDVCARHAEIIRARLVRQGNRNVRIVPAGWTPQDDCKTHLGTGQVHNLDTDKAAILARISADAREWPE